MCAIRIFTVRRSAAAVRRHFSGLPGPVAAGRWFHRHRSRYSDDRESNMIETPLFFA
jgi:hypothetical protein